MIHIINKSSCVGCEACVQICPKQCIKMHEDAKGFLYPCTNEESCIACGRCEKVCPELNVHESREPLEVYAAKNHNEEIRMQSSSGGIFTLLAEAVIDEGGVVFGARFDDKWEVMHDYTETKEGLKPFRGSKYVQSRIGKTYQQAERFLKSGRKVMFTATPCQIAGLKLFLQREYENLLAVEVACHGVPSPKVWKHYLHESVNRAYKVPAAERKSISLQDSIKNIDFRFKSKGWKNFHVCIEYINGENAIAPFDENDYMAAFLSNLSLRSCCYKCTAKINHTQSDITLADFWGIDKINPEIDDDRGYSLVIINNVDKKQLLQSMNCNLYPEPYHKAVEYNNAIATSVREPVNRSFFFALLIKFGFFAAYKATITPSLFMRIVRKIYRKL